MSQPAYRAAGEAEVSSRAELSPVQRVGLVRRTMQKQAGAIHQAAEHASVASVRAAEQISRCSGNLILTGVGKAGWIAQKLGATFSSLGCPAHFLHPSEAIHGDLGRVRRDDLVLAFSNSGRSAEVVTTCRHLKTQAAGLLVMTAATESPLAELADLVIPMGRHEEACPMGLAPTSSTSVMLAIGDAIAVLVSQLSGFQSQDFAKFHPGGALGRKLSLVDEIMRPVQQCRVVSQECSIREAIASRGGPRRSGAVMLVDASGILTGIFTDSDLARLLQRREETNLDDPIANCMTRDCLTIDSGHLLSEAVEILSQRRLSELPVVNDQRHPIGLIDITDLIAAGDIKESVPQDPVSVQTTSTPVLRVVTEPSGEGDEQAGDQAAPNHQKSQTRRDRQESRH